MYLKKVKSKNLYKKTTYILLASWKPLTKRAGSGSVIQWTDPSIRIHLKMSRIWNTACENESNTRAPNSVFRIHIHLIRIRIQHFRLNTDWIRIQIQSGSWSETLFGTVQRLSDVRATSIKLYKLFTYFFTFDVGAHAAAVPECDVTEATVSGPDGLLILQRMTARNPARARATQHLKKCCGSWSIEFVCLLDPSIIKQK